MTTLLSPLELFALDGYVAPEDLAIRDVVEQFVAKRIKPNITDWYEAGEIPIREIAPELGQLGVLGMHLDGYGCAGTSAIAYGLACLELEAGDSGLRSLVSVQGSLAMYAIWAFGSEEHKQHWLPLLAVGDAIGCFGLTESGHGSDPAGMRTHARLDGGDWILSGSKMWITNGSAADVAIVWAQTDSGVRGFVVPTDIAGFSASAIKRKMSLRASVTSELVLDDVRLPAEAMLPKAAGLSGPLSCLNEARFGLTFGAMGAARDSLECAIAYSRDREIFDKPLAAYQLTQMKIANMTLELGKGVLLALHLGRLKDEGSLTREQVSVGKLNNVREAIKIVRESRTILGAAGITGDYPIMRHSNNLESVLTYEGTSEIHQLVIGQAVSGYPAFR